MVEWRTNTSDQVVLSPCLQVIKCSESSQPDLCTSSGSQAGPSSDHAHPGSRPTVPSYPLPRTLEVLSLSLLEVKNADPWLPPDPSVSIRFHSRVFLHLFCFYFRGSPLATAILPASPRSLFSNSLSSVFIPVAFLLFFPY